MDMPLPTLHGLVCIARHSGHVYLALKARVLQAASQEVPKEGWGVVHGHLLVVEGAAVQEAAQKVPAPCHRSCSACLCTRPPLTRQKEKRLVANI